MEEVNLPGIYPVRDGHPRTRPAERHQHEQTCRQSSSFNTILTLSFKGWRVVCHDHFIFYSATHLISWSASHISRHHMTILYYNNYIIQNITASIVHRCEYSNSISHVNAIPWPIESRDATTPGYRKKRSRSIGYLIITIITIITSIP